MIYSIDFETRSTIDLARQGLDKYANDPSTEVLCIAFGTTFGNVIAAKPNSPNKGILLDGGLLQHVRNGGRIQAWNAMFEFFIWNRICVPRYGWPELKIEQCIDSMAIAAYNNVPQALGNAAIFMDSEYKKDTRGKYLINQLCKPNRKSVFNEDPVLMKELFEYCKQDVRTEMGIVGELRPLLAAEQKVWELTQKINFKGVPVDPIELHNAVIAVQRAQKVIDDETLELTGCKPSERAKLLAWVNSFGANMEDMTKKTVTAKLADSSISANVRQALMLRQEGSQTSVAKYAKMLEIQRDGRIRNTLVYHGASTGRWASRGGLNLQNIARPTIKDEEIEAAIPSVFGGDVGDMLRAVLPMGTLASLVRSAIKAPKGRTFVDVDFSSIENRVGVWLAGQNDKVELFRKGLDEYKFFAANSLYRIPYEDVTKDQRQIAKSAVLGAMFGQGAKGLVKYAAGMGVILTEDEAKKQVDNYRSSYAKVKALWASCEEAATCAVDDPGKAYLAGQNIVLKVAKECLWMKLPSNRLICWQRPEMEEVTTPWGATKYGVTVHSLNTYTRAWTRNQLIGSSIFQSAVQGTARDFLAYAMLNLDKQGYEIINSIHDEVLLLVDEADAEESLKKVTDIMVTPPSWAPDFPLAAEGWTGKRYRK